MFYTPEIAYLKDVPMSQWMKEEKQLFIDINYNYRNAMMIKDISADTLRRFVI